MPQFEAAMVEAEKPIYKIDANASSARGLYCLGTVYEEYARSYGYLGDMQKGLDYLERAAVEGVYEGDPARIERSVHPDLVKGGFFVQEGQTASSFTAMTFPQLVQLALHSNRDGRMPADAAKEVTIYAVTDQIASVKLVAWWGIDYMHLAK